MELAGEAEKLAKRLHPRDEEAAERHAVDTFLGALDQTLVAEVQKLGHRTMEDVVAASRRIEKILEEQADTKMERLVSTVQDQIRLLKKDLEEANEQIAADRAAAPPVAAMAAVPAPTAAATTAAAQPPPTAQAPSTAPTRHVNHDYGDEVDFPRLPRRRIGCRPPRCFLCDEEGHVARPIVLYAPSSNASSNSRRVPAPITRLRDLLRSRQPPRTTRIPALRCS